MISRLTKGLPIDTLLVIGVTGAGFALSMGMLWHTWVSAPDAVWNKSKQRPWLTGIREQYVAPAKPQTQTPEKKHGAH